MTLKLSLAAINEVKFKDGATKYQYIFFSENEKAYTGWSDEAKYQDLVTNTNSFTAARARDWEVAIRENNQKITYRVLVD